MNKIVIGLISSIFGAAIGSFATYKILEKRFEEQIEVEMDAVKDMYKKDEPEVSKIEEEIKTTDLHETDSMSKYAKKIYERRQYARQASEYLGSEEAPSEKPYPIIPDDFMMIEGYEERIFTCFDDNVIADINYHKIDTKDVDDIIGLESLSHMGEYEEDMLYVRNERYKIDCEITRDYRSFEQAVEESAPSMKYQFDDEED